MNGLKKFLKEEAKGWKAFDFIWLGIATAVILGLSVYWDETAVGIASALTGVWCVIFTGRGKRSSFIFGFFNVLFYAYIAYEAKFYGEVMLNLIYYFPMNFVGWYAWKKHMNVENGEVVKQRLSLKNSLWIYTLTGIAIFGYGLILQLMGGNLPYIDSMSTVVSVVAQILSVRRLVEQWVLWIVVDVVTIIMWAIAFVQGTESIATLAMWSVYLINAVIMYVKWYREAKQSAV